MNIKKLFLLILVAMLSGISFSQVSGYMGKRLSLSYSNYFSPSLLGRSANSTTDFSLGLNTTHCGNLEYVIKKRTNFCIGIQFSKLGTIKESYNYTFTYVDPWGNSSYLQSGTAYYLPSNRLPMQLKMTNIAVGFKFFRSGYIAPVGKYNKLEFVLFMSDLTYESKSFYSSPSRRPEDKISTSMGSGHYEFKSFAVAFTFGRQRILFDRLILDTGIRFAVSPNMFVNYMVTDFFGDEYDKTIEEQIKFNTNTRIFTSQVFNFHIGLGFLAF